MDLSERIVTVIGPEDLVITVGQQLSWIVLHAEVLEAP